MSFDLQELINRFAVAEQMDSSDPSIYDYISAYLEMSIESLDGERPDKDDIEWSGLWTWDEADYLYRNLPA